MQTAPVEFRPFTGASRKELEELWGELGPALRALQPQTNSDGMAKPDEGDQQTRCAAASRGSEGPEPAHAPTATPSARRGSAGASGPDPANPGDVPDVTSTCSLTQAHGACCSSSVYMCTGTADDEWQITNQLIQGEFPTLQSKVSKLLAEAKDAALQQHRNMQMLHGTQQEREQAVDDQCRFNGRGEIGNQWLSALPTDPFTKKSDDEVRGGV